MGCEGGACTRWLRAGGSAVTFHDRSGFRARRGEPPVRCAIAAPVLPQALTGDHQNNILDDISKQDSAANADANTKLIEQYKQRQQDLGKTSQEVESSAQQFAEPQ